MLGDQLIWLVVGAATALSLALLVGALFVRRLDQRALLIGARNGALVALALAVLVVLPVTLVSTGQRFLWGTLDVQAALLLGLLIGLPLAIGYFALGALLMVGGLLLGAQPSWATRGAWLAAPVAAVVFVSATGFALAMAQRAGEPVVASRPGQVRLQLAGASREELSIAGPALCEASASGTFEVFAGEQGAPPLEGPAGEEVTVQLTIHDELPALLVIRLGELGAYPGRGWDISPKTVRLGPRWTRSTGELGFDGLVPLDPDAAEPLGGQVWQGRLSWSCAD